MKAYNIIRLATLLLIGVTNVLQARADAPLKVVATLPTFASLVEEVGGTDVDVSAVASPRFNPHFIEPRPSDVLRIKRADLFVHSGLDLEVWRDPLINAVGKSEFRRGESKQLDLSVGIPLLQVPTADISRAQGDIHQFGNPHFWVGPQNGKSMVNLIAAKLSELDPERASRYQERATQFNKRLEQKMVDWTARCRTLKGRHVIGYHDEWAYLMEFTGMRMERFLEPKPGIPPSPQHLQGLKNEIVQRNVAAIVQSTFFPKDSSDKLGRETNIPVLLLCQSVGELPECSDYISMMEYNIESMLAAVK
jgi:zinc/manganese transport system substrate-binding protein